MRRIGAILFVGLLVAGILVFIPSSPAIHAESQSVVGLYFDDPTSHKKPTAADSKTRSVCDDDPPGSLAAADVCIPGYTPQVWFAPTADNGVGTPYSLSSEVLGVLWLSASSPEPLPISSVTIEIRTRSTGPNLELHSAFTVDRSVKNGSLATSTDDEPLIRLGPEPQKLLLGFPLPPGLAPIAADKKMALVLKVAVPAGVKNNGNVDVRLHYGSAEHASGLIYGITAEAGSTRIGTMPFRASLAADSLQFDLPTSLTGGTKLISPSFPQPGDEVPWTPVPMKAPVDYLILSDMLFNATLQLAGIDDSGANAGTFIELKVNLYIGSDVYTGVTQNGGNIPNNNDNEYGSSYIHPDAGAGEAPTKKFRVVAALPTEGIVIPAGTDIELKLQILASVPEGQYMVHFGSRAIPSGLFAAALATGTVVETDSDSGPAPTEVPFNYTALDDGEEGEDGDSGDGNEGGHDGDADDDDAHEDEGVKVKDLRKAKTVPGFTMLLLVGAVLAGVVLYRRR